MRAAHRDTAITSAQRLATLGKGQSSPIASNDSEAGRQANRRVEIYVEPVVQS